MPLRRVKKASLTWCSGTPCSVPGTATGGFVGLHGGRLEPDEDATDSAGSDQSVMEPSLFSRSPVGLPRKALRLGLDLRLLFSELFPKH